MLFIDLTSESDVFNSTSPQGHWLYHKFGKRNFPTGELDLEEVKNFISKENPKDIICHSYFGDPLFYTKIISFAEYCYEEGINLMLFTYGNFKSKNDIDRLTELNVKFYIFLCGNNKNNSLVYLNSSKDNIQYIFENIKAENLFIEYSLYDHNVNDLKEILQDVLEKRCNIKVSYGNLLGNTFTNIMNEKGTWLYDIHKCNVDYDFMGEFIKGTEVLSAINTLENLEYKSKGLFQSAPGYLLLRTFIYERGQKNIFDVTLEKVNAEQFLNYDGDTYINYLGYIFKNRDIYETFSNSLCDDWSENLKRNGQLKIENSLFSSETKKIIHIKSKNKANEKLKIVYKDFDNDMKINLDFTEEGKTFHLLSFLANEDLSKYHISKQF
jgi:hypothetical protein